MSFTNTKIKFHLQVPLVQKKDWITNADLLTPHLQTQVGKLGPRSKTNGLLHLISKPWDFDSLYQYLRFVLHAVWQVYGDGTVEVVLGQEQTETKSVRLQPIESKEEEVIEIFFEWKEDSSSEDLGERPMTVVGQIVAMQQRSPKRPRRDVEADDEKWKDQFTKLVAFHKTFGHYQIAPVDAELFQWAQEQRKLYETNELATDRRNRLQQELKSFLEWKDQEAEATTPEDTWDAQYRKLQFFHQLQGHCNVPMKNYNSDPALPIWVRMQRQSYHQGELTPQQTNQLNNLHFIWGLGEDMEWDDAFSRLVSNPGAHDETDDELGAWVATQRELKESQQLSQAAIDKLEGIGFEWTPLAPNRIRKVARKSVQAATAAVSSKKRASPKKAALPSKNKKATPPKQKAPELSVAEQEADTPPPPIAPEPEPMLEEPFPLPDQAPGLPEVPAAPTQTPVGGPPPATKDPEELLAEALEVLVPAEKAPTDEAQPPAAAQPIRIEELPDSTALLEEKIQLQEDTVHLQEEQVDVLKEKLEMHGKKAQLQKANRHLVKQLEQQSKKKKETTENNPNDLQTLRDKVSGQEKELAEQAETLKEKEESIRKVLQQIQEKKDAAVNNNNANVGDVGNNNEANADQAIEGAPEDSTNTISF